MELRLIIFVLLYLGKAADFFVNFYTYKQQNMCVFDKVYVYAL